MNAYTVRTLTFSIIAFFACALAGCNDESGLGKTSYLEYSKSSGWSCISGENCQDVYEIAFSEDSLVSFSVSNVGGGSVAQIALYAPGVALGGINLFTTTNDELRCRTGAGCSDYTAGEQVTDFPIPSTGIYSFAVTRHDEDSCGQSGTYDLDITSNTPFSFMARTVNDVKSLATDYTCTM
jgi:hypothetical protein